MIGFTENGAPATGLRSVSRTAVCADYRGKQAVQRIKETGMNEKHTYVSDLVRLTVVLLASVLMALNIKTFVRAGGLYPGGATGLSILIQRAAGRYLSLELPYTLINVVLNAIPVYIGFRFIGKKFTSLSLIMILVSSVMVDMIPAATLTSDILLISIFGGIINGIVISLCLSVDATSGGTDFISIFLSQKRGVDSFNIILGLNVLILSAAGILFGWDKALYSIIFQYVSTQTIHLCYRNYQQITLFINTCRPEEVCSAIYAVSGHGATIISAMGSHSKEAKPLVYSVVAMSDERRVIRAIREVDECAFIDCVRTKEMRGNFYYSPKD